MISARCVARDLHKIVPGPLERTCLRRFAVRVCAFECDYYYYHYYDYDYDDDDDDDDDYYYYYYY